MSALGPDFGLGLGLGPGLDNVILDLSHVTKNNLVETLPSWGKFFEISLKIWVESFSGNNDGWSELLRFTATENNWGSPGDRIPAIFLNSDGYIHFTSQVGKNGNFYENAYVKPKSWIKVEIKQYPKNGKVINYVDWFSNNLILLGNF